MVCRSGSVERAADKSTKAAEQVKKLEDALKARSEAVKKEFYDEIDTHLADAKITDARQLEYASDIKTEYTSEFSLDKIAGVVVSALKAAIAASAPGVEKPAMSEEAINAYVDVVNTVAEAAKSNSESSSSLSFSMTRLAPGMFGFLKATSTNIRDEDTFGSEEVTSTAIYYRLMQSIDDIKNQAEFGETVIDAANLKKMKELQAGLTDLLAEGKLTVDEWIAKDGAYEGMIQTIRDRLKAHGWDEKQIAVLESSVSGHARRVSGALSKLRTMGSEFTKAIEVSEARLRVGHFN